MEEKYNKWNDKHTSINPFIQHKQKDNSNTPNIILRFILIIIAIIKLPFLIVTIIILLANTFLSYFVPISFIKHFLIYIPARICLLLMGAYSIDDSGINKQLERSKNKKIVFLSNSVSLIDGIYYIMRFPSIKIVVTHAFANKSYYLYEVIGPLKIIVRLLLFKQPYFILHKDGKQIGSDIGSIIQKSNINKYNLVFFYEGIRTNGLGTLQPHQILIQNLYKTLTSNILCIHFKYISNTPINSVFKHPLRVIFNICCSPSVTVKAKSTLIQHQQINSNNQLKKQLKETITLNGSRLLDVKAESYFDFIQYYNQKS